MTQICLVYWTSASYKDYSVRMNDTREKLYMSFVIQAKGEGGNFPTFVIYTHKCFVILCSPYFEFFFHFLILTYIFILKCHYFLTLFVSIFHFQHLVHLLPWRQHKHFNDVTACEEIELIFHDSNVTINTFFSFEITFSKVNTTYVISCFSSRVFTFCLDLDFPPLRS